MSKLIKADLYRLFRTKSYYICTGILLVMSILSLLIMKGTEIFLGEVVFSLLELTGISYGASAVAGGDIVIFTAIFISVFITQEFVFGTMKNVVSKGFSRVKIYLSKLITMIVATAIMLIALFIVSTVAATIATGELGEITGTFVLEFLRMFAIELLLYSALSSVFVMIAMIVRSNGATIAINIIGVIMFSSLIYELVSLLFKRKYNFYDYSLLNNINTYYINMSPAFEDIIRSIIVGVAFLTVSTLIGVLVFRKTDVK